MVIARFQAISGHAYFVETGTHVGTTLRLVGPLFRHCDTIELAPDLQRLARRGLAMRRNITFHLGSSADLLPGVLEKLPGPAILWLDAHFSGGTTAGADQDPLGAELQAVSRFADRGHIILIDDARGLGVTEEQLAAFEAALGPDYVRSMLHDAVRFVPRRFALPSPAAPATEASLREKAGRLVAAIVRRRS